MNRNGNAGMDEKSKVRQALTNARVFSDLPGSSVTELALRASLRRFPSQRTVMSHNDPGDAMYIVATGLVKLVILGENGREVTLAHLRAGETFGEMNIFDDQPKRMVDAVTMEPTQLVVLTRDDMRAHIMAHPRSAWNLMSQMAMRLRQSDEQIAQLALLDVNDRLMQQLITLAQKEGVEEPEGVLVRRRPTQQELANMVGSCRETVSRAFNQLSRDGKIVTKGRSLLVNKQFLPEIAKTRNAS